MTITTIEDISMLLATLTHFIWVPVLLIYVLAFTTKIIVAVIRSIFTRIKVKVITVVIALTISLLALLIYAEVTNFDILWYHIVLAVLLGFFVAYVTMNGVSKFAKEFKSILKQIKEISEKSGNN